MLSGCAQEKESLHEHEHDEPKHWPDNMAQAAEFIEARVQKLGETTTEPAEEIESELQDLVEWAPEIAADTGLGENDWVPIYEMSEAIRKHMRGGDVTAPELASDLEKLARLLREAHAKLNIEDDASRTPLGTTQGTTPGTAQETQEEPQ